MTFLCRVSRRLCAELSERNQSRADITRDGYNKILVFVSFKSILVCSDLHRGGVAEAFVCLKGGWEVKDPPFSLGIYSLYVLGITLVAVLRCAVHILVLVPVPKKLGNEWSCTLEMGQLVSSNLAGTL